VSALRKADTMATSAMDREHVGPWMARNCRSLLFSPELPSRQNLSHLRCTIDHAEDYRRITALFEGIYDPVNARWVDLLRKLKQLAGDQRFRVPQSGTRAASTLALGTVQLGMEYGRVNDSGKPGTSEAVKIIRRAVAHGVNAIDTARGYGDAESIIGEALQEAESKVNVVTKLDLSELRDSAPELEVRASVHASIKA